MVSTELEQMYVDLQLDTEDIVIETTSMLKKHYDSTMREVLDVIALWWIHNDIKDLADAQTHIDELITELDGIIDPSTTEYIEGMTELFAEVYAFNYSYARRIVEPTEKEQDNDTLLLLATMAIMTPWAEDGLRYTERMTNRMTALKDAIKAIVLRCSVLKWGTKRMLAEVRKEMTKSKYRGTNIIVDESNHFGNEGVKDATQELMDGYEISAVLDMKTCDTCRSMHGKRFTWEEYDVGLTAPMFHNSCRCRIIPIENK